MSKSEFGRKDRCNNDDSPDYDEDCFGDLVCGEDNCPSPFRSDADCCVKVKQV